MQNNPLRNYGEMLKGFREDIYMSQQEVARYLGVSKMAVSNWESGRNIPKPEYRKALKELYMMPVEADLIQCVRMYSKEELVDIVMSLIDKANK